MGNVITPEFRVSYPNVFEARLNDMSKKLEYSLVALFAKGADLSSLKKAAQEAITDKWGADQKRWPKKLRLPFRDQGEREKDVDGKVFMPDGYEKGAIFMNLKTTRKPGLVDSQVVEIINPEDFYAGCYARAQVACYAYDTAGNQGVGFGLNLIQKTRDGEPFSGRSKPEDAFSPIGGADISNQDNPFNPLG